MKALVIIALALASSGCTLLQTEVGPKVASAVNRYCQEPLQTRLLLRSSVNQMTAPNAVKVTCSGDPQ